MKSFLWKCTTDGKCHLYVNDSTKAGFQKIGQAEKIRIIKDPSHVILYSETKKSMTLFGISNDEVFKVKLPNNSSVEYINDNCIFERDNLWYTMVHCNNAWHETLLGVRKEILLTQGAILKYNRMKWVYFLKDLGDYGFQLGYFINGTFFPVGLYSKYFEMAGGKIAALSEDKYFDIYIPSSCHPIQGLSDMCEPRDNVFTALGGIFLWSEAKRKWAFHSNCSFWEKNAVLRIIGKYGERIELYRIDGDEIFLVDAGPWKWMQTTITAKKLELCIEGKIYSPDKDGMIDFDNPRPTLKKRIKDLFKRK